MLTAIAAAAFGLIAYVYLTLPDVRPLATVNPASTAFMEMRARQARAAGKPVRRVHRWVPYSRISRHLRQAVLAAEDSAFFDHDGLDYAELRKAVEEAVENGKEFRGASTLTQQLAKNLYLSPSRDPLRKLRELIITRRLETSLSKARIFEIYLNVVEWGEGVWGAEAAARTHFGVGAGALSREQAALLAGALINPIVHNPSRPTRRLLRRQQIILGRMGSYEPPAPEPVAVPAPADVRQPEESVQPQSEPDPPAEPEPALPEPAQEIDSAPAEPASSPPTDE